MNDEMKEHMTDGNIWMRGLYMVLFAIIYSIAEIVFTAVAIFQFLFVLVTGDKNENLLSFGKNLSKYVYQIVIFFTFNSEEKPFPFSSWPELTEDGLEKTSPVEKKETVEKKAPVEKKSSTEKKAPIAKKAPVEKKTPVAEKTPVEKKASAKKKAPAKTAKKKSVNKPDKKD